MGYQTMKFPEGTRFLVTGGAGFIGSNLCEAILGLGYDPDYDFETGLKLAIDWYKENL